MATYLAVAFLATAFYLTQLWSSPKLPSTLPRLKRSKAWLPFRLQWSYLTDCRKLFIEAYDTFSKNGKTCVLPSLGFKDEVHVANQHAQWAASQPDSVLSPIEGFRELDSGDWNSGHASYIQDPWQSLVIKKEMGSFLEVLANAVDDELHYAIPEYIHPNANGEVEVYESMKWILAQVSSRFTVGLTLCRDKGYLNQSLKFADLFILNSGLVIYTPSILRPLIGYLITLPTKYRRWRIKKYIEPLFRDRAQQLLHPELYPKHELPTDNLQMMMRYAIKKYGKQVTVSQISDRLCLANLASFHQTAVAMSNVLINIAASNAEFNTVDVIRQEMADVLSDSGGIFNKASVSKMIQTDSILKESMRTHAFGNRAMIRKVIAPNGLKTPDGHILPYGSTLSILAYPAHHDPEIYTNPAKFDPFRFSRIRTCSADNHDSSASSVKNANPTLSFVSTSPNYLPFGHGKHACPGRFLVDFELKMILCRILDLYDIELLPEHNGVRPECQWVTEAVMPPVGVKLRFTKRDACI